MPLARLWHSVRAGMVEDPVLCRWSSYGEAMAGGHRWRAECKRQGWKCLASPGVAQDVRLVWPGLLNEVWWLNKMGEQVVERQADDGGRAVAQAVGEDQAAGVDERAATVNDVGHVAFALVAFGL